MSLRSADAWLPEGTTIHTFQNRQTLCLGDLWKTSGYWRRRAVDVSASQMMRLHVPLLSGNRSPPPCRRCRWRVLWFVIVFDRFLASHFVKAVSSVCPSLTFKACTEAWLTSASMIIGPDRLDCLLCNLLQRRWSDACRPALLRILASLSSTGPHAGSLCLAALPGSLSQTAAWLVSVWGAVANVLKFTCSEHGQYSCHHLPYFYTEWLFLPETTCVWVIASY